MTCVVGVETEGGVMLAGDSLSGDGRSYCTAGPDYAKVFKAGPYAFGFADSWRLGNVLRHHLRLPAPPRSTKAMHRHMVTAAIPKVRDVLREHGLLSAQGIESAAGVFLIAARGMIFEVYSDLQASRFADGYTAIGSGAPHALGALYATKGRPPRERLRIALEASAQHSLCARAPWRFVFVPRDA